MNPAAGGALLLLYLLACLGAGALGMRASARAGGTSQDESGVPVIATCFVLGQGLLACL